MTQLPSAIDSRLRLVFAAGLGLLLILGYAVYRPGLSGEFVLDDIPNLIPLKANLYLPTRDRLLVFILDGGAGPTGRPLSLLSFLIEDHAWPTSAPPFKYTNVLLHLLNGTLVFWLAWLLAVHAPDSQSPTPAVHNRAFIMALVAAGLWLWQPLQASTVLYVVQRMTLLASLFMLAGMVCYVKGRRLAPASPWAGYGLMTSGVVVGGLLSTFSKEIGVLLPLYLLVLEYTLLRRLSRPPHWQFWSVLFLWAPSLMLVAWQYLDLPGTAASYIVRPFTLEQRLLTEPRVLWDYLFRTLLPRRDGSGIFHDDYPISTHILEPPSTLFAVAGLTAAFLAALIWRTRIPWFSFAVLWFIAGHSLEAGPIPLEIYFEHRNYLPMIGPLFALSTAIVRSPQTYRGLRQVLPVAAALYLALTATAAWQNATVWGNTLLQAELAQSEHPQSQRAAQFAAQAWVNAGRLDLARAKLLPLAETRPDIASIQLQMLLLNCLTGTHTPRDEIERRLAGLPEAAADNAVPETIQFLRDHYRAGRCLGLEMRDIERICELLLANPNFRLRSGLMGRLSFLLADLLNLRNEKNAAIDLLEQSLSYQPTVDKALTLAYLYVTANRWREAASTVERAAKLDRHGLLGINLRAAEIDAWRALLNSQDNR